MIFIDADVAYMRQQPIGRLATVAFDGAVQNNPVSFHMNTELGVIDVGGYNMGASKKFRHVEQGSVRVAFVVDELISVHQPVVEGIRRRVEGIRRRVVAGEPA